MTNETQQEQQERYAPHRVYEFPKENCSEIKLQGVPYAFFFTLNNSYVPEEVKVRVWNSKIDNSLLEKLRNQIPSAFDSSGNMLEAILMKLTIETPLMKDAENEVCFRRNLAKLFGYEYFPQRKEGYMIDCENSGYYTIPASLEKIEAKGDEE